MKSLEYYFKKAKREKWAIGQFNFSELPQLEGIIEAAKEMHSPIILGTSEGESRFLGLKQAVALKKAYQMETGLPIFLNLDHGKSFDYIKKAIELGYDMVHFDGSKLSLKENISTTKEVVKYAKKFGVLVEGEIGIIGTDVSKVYEGKFEIEEKNLTNLKEAVEYIKETGVDCLAVSIGSFHGVSTESNPNLNFEKLKDIKKNIKDSFLVLHGGSGTPKKDIKKAIKLGIVKININTELRLIYTDTLKKFLKENPKEITPYKYLPETVKAVKGVVEDKIRLFNSKNKV
ncbi:class II fructose-bisphosphate aldolase [Patescibacteria group bacterium]|nr:class II fructose-bisphosphate aldolase [Patescibacteria group bacterium]